MVNDIDNHGNVVDMDNNPISRSREECIQLHGELQASYKEVTFTMDEGIQEEERTQLLEDADRDSLDMVADVELFHSIFDQPLRFAWDLESLRLRMKLMKEEFEETYAAMETAIDELYMDDRVSVETSMEILDGLVDQTVINIGTADIIGWDFRGAWSEVLASNLSKVQKDGTVLRREDGKILKGEDFKAPDLEPFVSGFDCS